MAVLFYPLADADLLSPQTGLADYPEAEQVVSRLAQQSAVSIKIFLTSPRDQRFLLWQSLTRLVNHTTRSKFEYTFPAMAETMTDLIILDANPLDHIQKNTESATVGSEQ